MLAIVGALVCVALAAGLVSMMSPVAAQEQKPGAQAKPGGGGGAAIPVQVAAVAATTLQQKVTLTGDFQPQDKVSVVSRITARITRIPVEVGQPVKAGDTLIELDKSSLDAAMAQAQAQVTVARANLKKLEVGARPEDVAAAEAASKQASERLVQSQTNATSVRAQDVANAQAAIAAAEARLRQVTQGPTVADIASGEATLRGAQARLQTTVNGSKAQDIEVQQQVLNQAKENRTKLESQLANTKEQARLSLDQAGSSLRSSQSNYGAAKLIYDDAVRTGKDPTIAKCPAAGPKNCQELTDAKLRQFKATFESAEQTMRQAEATLEQRQLAYEDAKKQEIVSLSQADAQIMSAQATLDKLKAGATNEEVDASKSAVDQAQAALDKLNQPARQADIDAAQAAVNQARAALAKLQATPTDVAIQQAAVEQAKAAADKAANPYLATDLEAAAAQVAQAEAGVKTAQVNLQDAVIVAPFNGVISAKNVSEGSLTSASTTLLEVIGADLRGFFTIEEAQVGQVKVGQAAVLTTTAYPGEKFDGSVTVINPTASSVTRSFGLRVQPKDPQSKLKAGMFAQAELVTSQKANALAVPEAAVLTRDGKTVVFVAVDGKAQRKDVVTGLRADGKVELTQGVQAGDQVIVVGQNLLNDGDAVQVR